MNYSNEIEIKASREQVIRLFTNPEKRLHWQQGFISFEPLEGAPGAEGAKGLLKLRMGKREITMTETIRKNNLPEELHFIFEAKNIYNIQENFFETTPQATTRWICNNEFKFSGPMKLAGTFRPGSFRKQTSQNMNDFKEYVEKSGSET